MHRLFIGLRPPPAIRDRLIDMMEGIAAARWQDDEQLHVTIRFIGTVDRQQAEDVASAIEALHAPAPAVRLDGVGTFAKKGVVHTLFSGLAPANPLAALHRKVDQALARVGIEPEHRAFKPHLTLARFSRATRPDAELDRFLADHAALSSPVFTLAHLTLFESHLAPDGARYTPVMRVALDAEPAAD